MRWTNGSRNPMLSSVPSGQNTPLIPLGGLTARILSTLAVSRPCMRRLCVAFSLALLVNIAPASFPTEQRVPNDRNGPLYAAVGRVQSGPVADHFRGSGSVICVGRLPDGTRRFAFLTADHVIGNPVRNDPLPGPPEYRPYGNSDSNDQLLPQLNIAFGNNPNVFHSPSRDNLGQPLIFRGGPNGQKDYAVLIIDYNGDEGDDFFRTLSLNHLSVGVVNDPVGKDMTSVGFGVTGINFGGGYEHRYVSGPGDPHFGVYGWGTKRFWNNKIERTQMREWKFYAYDAFEVTNTMPGGAGAVDGEGIGASGDSGAPYLFEGESHITIDGQRIRVRDRLIGGVHTGGSIIPLRDDPQDPNRETGYRKPWGSLGYAVRFDQNDVNWIMQKCAFVPEPASISALFAGLAGLFTLNRRRRAS